MASPSSHIAVRRTQLAIEGVENAGKLSSPPLSCSVNPATPHRNRRRPEPNGDHAQSSWPFPSALTAPISLPKRPCHRVRREDELCPALGLSHELSDDRGLGLSSLATVEDHT